MRNLPNLKAERYRIGGEPNSDSGQFVVEDGPLKTALMVQASTSGGWDHVSVSCANRCPIWEEMEHVRKIFFKDDEWCLQYGVPGQANISYHAYTLHWWRPQCEMVPRPPAWMVGPTPAVDEWAEEVMGMTRQPWEKVRAINQLFDGALDLFQAAQWVLLVADLDKDPQATTESRQSARTQAELLTRRAVALVTGQDPETGVTLDDITKQRERPGS